MLRIEFDVEDTATKDGTGALRLYLSGPMTGMPGFNRLAFREAAATLRAQGYEVASPAELPGDDGDPWAVWMRRALGLLLTCHAVAFLPGWEASRGARLEYRVAQALGMPLYQYDMGWLKSLT